VTGHPPVAESSAAGHDWVPRAAATTTVLLGVVNLLGVVSQSWHARLVHLLGALPGVMQDAATLATAVIGILFIGLADGLARRKRRAWAVAVVLLAGSAILRLLSMDTLSLHAMAYVAVSVTLLVPLVAFRSEFDALPDPRSGWHALLVVSTTVVAGTLTGLLIVAGRAHAAGMPQAFTTRLGAVWAGLVGVQTPFDQGNGRDDDFVYYALLGIGLAIVVTAAYQLLRSPWREASRTDDDDRRLQQLLAAHGDQDSLGYFSLRPDKAVVWSPSGKSGIAYRVVGGVMLASGDPIGDREAWPGAISRFLATARCHGWVPAAAGCSEAGARIWAREAGWQALEIGDEAIVEVAEFDLSGRAMRGVRQMANRARRQGYSTQYRRLSDVSHDELVRLAGLAAQWRVGAVERGYSMALGRLGGPGDGDCVVATAELDGEVKGLIHLVPWGRAGWSLDLMRRAPDADPGVNDLLITDLLATASTVGIAQVSLNFAVFRGALERGLRLGAPPLTRAWRRLLLMASRWVQIDSLYRFNAKFRPEWEPRFLVYPTTRDFARVTLAYLRAEAFLVSPWRRRSRPGLASWPVAPPRATPVAEPVVAAVPVAAPDQLTT
jgi:lysyl-tRNA synthetase class 2